MKKMFGKRTSYWFSNNVIWGLTDKVISLLIC
jgi:hypothetical protein